MAPRLPAIASAALKCALSPLAGGVRNFPQRTCGILGPPQRSHRLQEGDQSTAGAALLPHHRKIQVRSSGIPASGTIATPSTRIERAP